MIFSQVLWSFKKH